LYLENNTPLYFTSNEYNIKKMGKRNKNNKRKGGFRKKAFKRTCKVHEELTAEKTNGKKLAN